MTNLIFSVGEDEEVISISDIFPPAFLYENEIHDLFGINIKMMNVDYKGNLYRLSQKTPYKNI
jgi:ech hydrogenase subunit D